MFTNKIVTDMVIHLLNQGECAILTDDPWRTCAYRSENGLMCAVGCVIPDENYDEEFDADPDIDFALMSAIDGKYRVDPDSEEDTEFLRKCQAYLHDNHDSVEEPNEFRRRVLSGIEDLQGHYPKLRPNMKRIRAEGTMPETA